MDDAIGTVGASGDDSDGGNDRARPESVSCGTSEAGGACDSDEFQPQNGEGHAETEEQFNPATGRGDTVAASTTQSELKALDSSK